MGQHSGDYSKRELTVYTWATVHPSAHELAEIFWAMDDEEQAAFFNKLGEVADIKLHFQLAYVSNNPELAKVGRWAMEVIGEYSND